MSQEAQVVKWNCPCGNSYKFHGFTEAKPQRQWVGLTDDELESIWPFVWRTHESVRHLTIYRAIEAKLKEKNQ